MSTVDRTLVVEKFKKLATLLKLLCDRPVDKLFSGLQTIESSQVLDLENVTATLNHVHKDLKRAIDMFVEDSQPLHTMVEKRMRIDQTKSTTAVQQEQTNNLWCLEELNSIHFEGLFSGEGDSSEKLEKRSLLEGPDEGTRMDKCSPLSLASDDEYSREEFTTSSTIPFDFDETFFRFGEENSSMAADTGGRSSTLTTPEYFTSENTSLSSAAAADADDEHHATLGQDCNRKKNGLSVARSMVVNQPSSVDDLNERITQDHHRNRNFALVPTSKVNDRFWDLVTIGGGFVAYQDHGVAGFIEGVDIPISASIQHPIVIESLKQSLQQRFMFTGKKKWIKKHLQTREAYYEAVQIEPFGRYTLHGQDLGMEMFEDIAMAVNVDVAFETEGSFIKECALCLQGFTRPPPQANTKTIIQHAYVRAGHVSRQSMRRILKEQNGIIEQYDESCEVHIYHPWCAAFLIGLQRHGEEVLCNRPYDAEKYRIPICLGSIRKGLKPINHECANCLDDLETMKKHA